MTQINATILSTTEFDAKAKELDNLIASIELYSATEDAAKNKDEVQELFDDLSKNLYALDCAYLDAKMQTFTRVLNLLKP